MASPPREFPRPLRSAPVRSPAGRDLAVPGVHAARAGTGVHRRFSRTSGRPRR